MSGKEQGWAPGFIIIDKAELVEAADACYHNQPTPTPAQWEALGWALRLITKPAFVEMFGPEKKKRKNAKSK